MKKKILSLFVTLAMVCGFVSIFLITPANASPKDDYYQLHLADYLSDDPAAASFLNREINMPYRKHVEERTSDTVYSCIFLPCHQKNHAQKSA